MKAWHFLRTDGRLRYGDNRQVEPGQTYTVLDDRPLELCDYGLHGSKRLLDALRYAPGPIVCRVELIGERIDGDDKSVAYQRRVLWMFDATNVLRDFARRCAIDVIQLWDAPEIVVRYLKTGDESLRAAAAATAAAAAEGAAAVAAEGAALAAGWGAAAGAAWAAAAAAARAAAAATAAATAEAVAEAAAWAAATAAAEGAALDRQNRRLTAMIAEWLFRNDPMSARSERNLKDVRPDLVRVIRRAWMMRGGLDFEVICGHRGEAAQNKAYRNGYSKLPWPRSKHNKLPSWAVDVIPKPIPRTSEGWDEPEYLDKFDGLAKLIIAAANIEKVAIEWGGKWTMRDMPHWEVVE